MLLINAFPTIIMPVGPTEEFNQLMAGVAVAVVVAITKIVVEEVEEVEEAISALTHGKSLRSTARRSGFIHRIGLKKTNDLIYQILCGNT